MDDCLISLRIDPRSAKNRAAIGFVHPSSMPDDDEDTRRALLSLHELLPIEGDVRRCDAFVIMSAL